MHSCTVDSMRQGRAKPAEHPPAPRFRAGEAPPDPRQAGAHGWAARRDPITELIMTKHTGARDGGAEDPQCRCASRSRRCARRHVPCCKDESRTSAHGRLLGAPRSAPRSLLPPRRGGAAGGALQARDTRARPAIGLRGSNRRHPPRPGPPPASRAAACVCARCGRAPLPPRDRTGGRKRSPTGHTAPAKLRREGSSLRPRRGPGSPAAPTCGREGRRAGASPTPPRASHAEAPVVPAAPGPGGPRRAVGSAGAAAGPLSRGGRRAGAAQPHLNFWKRSLSASNSCRRTSLGELALCHSTSFLKWGSLESAMLAAKRGMKHTLAGAQKQPRRAELSPPPPLL